MNFSACFFFLQFHSMTYQGDCFFFLGGLVCSWVCCQILASAASRVNSSESKEKNEHRFMLSCG